MTTCHLYPFTVDDETDDEKMADDEEQAYNDDSNTKRRHNWTNAAHLCVCVCVHGQSLWMFQISFFLLDFPGDPESSGDQLDNNLPATPFLSKMARLNSECSNAALQTNCLPGQKWRCVNEGGQWRKQKCKFHVSHLSPRERWPPQSHGSFSVIFRSI